MGYKQIKTKKPKGKIPKPQLGKNVVLRSKRIMAHGKRKA